MGLIASSNTKLADLDLTYTAELVNDGPMAITAAPAGSSQSMSCVQSQEDSPPICTFVWILPLGDLAVVNSTVKANVTFYEVGGRWCVSRVGRHAVAAIGTHVLATFVRVVVTRVILCDLKFHTVIMLR